MNLFRIFFSGSPAGFGPNAMESRQKKAKKDHEPIAYFYVIGAPYTPKKPIALQDFLAAETESEGSSSSSEEDEPKTSTNIQRSGTMYEFVR